MKISSDQYIVYSNGFITINYTLIYSWVVMAILIILALILRSKITKEKEISTIQSIFETIISLIENQIKEISSAEFKMVFPFVATLFLYIVTSNLMGLIPSFRPPTESLSTTIALALIVTVYSFIVGFKAKGLGYLKKYLQPIFFMLPFNILGDFSRIISLSFRLYGNIMSSGIIVLILSQIKFLSIGIPIAINLLGFISGIIQAYIFSILSMIALSVDD